MERMPLNKIVFGKTDAFNELNTFGQKFFVDSFVSNPKYHVEDFISGSRFFIDLIDAKPFISPHKCL